MKRRICVALALMIALMLSVCAVADEYETVAPTQDVEDETPVISAGSIEEEVGEAKEADLDDLPEEASTEESTEDEKAPEETMIEEQSEEERSEEETPAVVEEPAEEKSEEEEPAGEEPAEEEPADERLDGPWEVAVAEPVEELPEMKAPVANELTYNGDAQALVSARDAWLYSLDGESFGEDIPTAVDAGEYTVFYKAEEDAEAGTLIVTVAKADVTFIPPVAAFIEE